MITWFKEWFHKVTREVIGVTVSEASADARKWILDRSTPTQKPQTISLVNGAVVALGPHGVSAEVFGEITGNRVTESFVDLDWWDIYSVFGYTDAAKGWQGGKRRWVEDRRGIDPQPTASGKGYTAQLTLETGEPWRHQKSFFDGAVDAVEGFLYERLVANANKLQ